MRIEDKLTSDERMKLLIEGKKIDRVPIIPHIESFAAKVANITTKELYLHPRSAFDAQIKCKQLFQHDGGIDYNIVNGYVADFEGGKIDFIDMPDSGYPRVLSKAIKCEKDIEKLKMPKVFDTFTGKRYLEFNRLLVDSGRSAVMFAGSPAMLAINLIDMKLLMKWMIKKPECVHQIMRFCTDYIVLMGKEYVKEFGAENVEAGMALPVESNCIMSPKMFEKFALPYIVEVFDRLGSMGIDISSIHLCGDHNKNLYFWKNDIKLLPRSLITIGAEMDLVYVAKEMGSDFILGGNLKNLTLQTGSTRDVYNEAKEIIESMKYFKGGFILTPDCTLSYQTPTENLEAMISAARVVGVY